MKTLTNRRISLLMAVLMALALLLQAPATMGSALAESGGEVFPEGSISYMEEDSLGAGEEIEGEQSVVGSVGLVESGESEEAGSAVVPGDDESLGGTGEEEFPSGSMSGVEYADETLGAGNPSVTLNPKIELSSSSVSLKQGNTSSVTVTISGFSGTVYLQYGTTNSSAYSCTWGGWSGSGPKFSIPLRIDGKGAGRGTITVYLKQSSNNKTLTSKTISVNVQAISQPKLKLSANPISIEVGSSQKVNVTASGYSGTYYLEYSIKNSSVVSCTWDSRWNGSSIGLTVKAKAAGTTTVTIYMRNYYTDALLAKAELSVSTYKKQTPKVTLSASSASMKVGNSVTVKATVSGYSGSYYLTYTTTGSSYYGVTWASYWVGSSINMTITGKMAGKGAITVYLKSSAGTTLASAKIDPVTVTSNNAPSPSVSASSTSVSIGKGATKSITLSVKNTTGSYYLQYGTTNTSAYSCSWSGYWSGSSTQLNITGKAKGSGKVTVYLKRSSDDKVLAQVAINVSVIAGASMQDIGYGFGNFSYNYISYDICKYMYGNNQKADAVYYWNIGNGGVCFGMASSAGLLDGPNSPYVSTFNSKKTRICDLVKDDRSSSLGLTVSQFVQAMHISQVSTQNVRVYNDLNKLVSTVKSETDAGRPVLIGIRGSYGGYNSGHAVLAFGYDQVSSTQCNIKIYDSNYVSSPSNMVQTTLKVTKSSSGGSYNTWSYPLTNSVTWGTGRTYASINYVTYSTYYNVWSKRGSLGLSGYNLLATNESSFSLVDFNGNTVARYENGQLVEKADSIYEVYTDGVLPGANAEQVNILYAPVDQYTVIDGTPDTPIELTLAGDDLSVRVETQADYFDICVNDNEELANAIVTPGEGESFSITLGSIVGGEKKDYTLDGVGDGTAVGLGLNMGQLSMVGGETASLSITGYDETHGIDAQATVGGTITPEGTTDIVAGQSILYTIEPEAGYTLKAVYVDNQNMGPINEYYFENVMEPHTIYAEFARNIDQCTVTLSQDAYIHDGTECCPSVTVRDPEGNVLEEYVDYEVSYENNVDAGTATVYVTAVREGMYSGTKTVSFTITEQSTDYAITGGSYNSSTKRVSVDFTNPGAAYIAVAGYNADGQMSIAKRVKVSANAGHVDISFSGSSLDNASVVKVIMMDSSFKPLCGSHRIK